ncbi:MAG: hemoglobin/transferrin/lactoferrin receptor protein, partial [Rickettsiales bacterium]
MRKITNMTCAAILLSTTALSSATISSALANSQKPTTSLDTVTVIATKNSRDTFDTPGMVTVINADDPSNAGSSSVKDLLEGAIGVEFNGSARRNGQNITMRGYGSNGLTILLDGVRQKSESAHDGKFFVDPNLLKKVEIVRGPSSTLYGSGGLGGVIAFETKNAADLLKKDQKLGAMTSLGFSSVNDEWLASQSVYGRSEKFDVLLNAVTRNSGDIKLASGDKLESEDKILNGMFKLGYSINDFSTLKLNISGYQNDAV